MPFFGFFKCERLKRDITSEAELRYAVGDPMMEMMATKWHLKVYETIQNCQINFFWLYSSGVSAAV